MPLQKPRARVASVDVRIGGVTGDALRRMITASPHVSLRQESSAAVDAQQGAADVTVSEIGTSVTGSAIQVVLNPGEAAPIDPAWTVAESHPLTRDLNWMGLLTPRPLELSLMEDDAPLLWKGDHLMALLRHERAQDGTPSQRLLLGWDLSQSNAARHPAVLVLLHRFIETVREGKRDAWAGNFETGQPVEVADFKLQASDGEPSAKPRLELRADGGETVPFTGRVPERPGFFEVLENGKPVVRGAAHFADAREADFRDAGALDTVDERRWEAAMKQTEADPWMPLWMLLVLGCLVTAWAWRQGSTTAASQRPRPLSMPATPTAAH
jgi:hypothetical protein